MKKFFLVALLLLSGYLGRAQTTADTLGIDYNVFVDSAFKQLDLSEVTSGFLLDRGLGYDRALPYTGLPSDTNRCDFSKWEAVYSVVGQAALDTLQGLPSPDSSYAAKALSLFRQEPGPLPIGLLHMQCHRISPTALNDNLLTLNGLQLHDVPNRTASPYLAHTVFAAAPLADFAWGLQQELVLQTDYFFTNTGPRWRKSSAKR